MANSYGYMPNVIHTIGADGRIIPITMDNPIPVVGAGGGSGVPSNVVVDSGHIIVDSGNIAVTGTVGVSGIVSTQGKNIVSSVNSTATPINANITFNGVGEDVLDYVAITVSIYASHSSADLGLKFQFSTDNINWITSDEYTYTTNGRKTYSLQRTARYFRVLYTNGAVNQTTFQLSTIYSSTVGIPSSHRVGDTVSADDDAQLVKSIISGETPLQTQINVAATTDGALLASVVTPTGALPVSLLTTLHDGKILNRLFPEINEIVGTGSGTFTNNKYNMSVTAGQWMVHTTRRFMPYFSGKPQKVELTFDNFAPQANVTKRVGYFSSSTVSPYDSTRDGFYLESSSGSIKFVIERAGTVVSSTDITAWTGYNVLSNYQSLAEWDNFTVVEFNFLWLGGAYIELRVVTDSGFTTVHKLVYAGTAQDTFIKSPNQPVRYEIRSTTGVGSFRYICNQVATSGSIEESAISHSVDTGTTGINCNVIGTTYPIIAVQKQAAYRDNAIRIHDANILVGSADTVRWSLQINPTLSASLTYNNTSNSSSAFALGNGTITVTSPGNIIASGYLVQNGTIDPSQFINNYLSWLSGSISGTQDQYVLCITPITTNVTVYGAITTLEG